MSYFEEEYIIINTEEESVANMEWLGLAKTEAYRTGMEQFLKLLEEHKSTLWLLNYAQGKVIDIKDQKWTTEEWLPVALNHIDHNLKKVAIILSQDIFNKVAVRLISGQIEQNSTAEIAYFENKSDAIDWLLTAEPQDQVEEMEITE
ncbi:MAG: hypothetical protein EAZ55_03755 [Cytophagales bacterium]|nr:MAG: hypothetical protein EAZ55_03755 [Cytophagales bacterium]